VFSQATLPFSRGCSGVLDAREDAEEGVTLGVNDAAPTRLDRLAEQSLVVVQHDGVVVAELPQQLGRALDVREQEGDGALVQLRRRPPCAEGSRQGMVVSSSSKGLRDQRLDVRVEAGGSLPNRPLLPSIR
jgi:hypothetical protein